MPYLTINGLDYYYDLQGAGSPLVLLHGFTGSSESWVEVIDLFSGRFQTIAIDLPGHGRTSSPPLPQRYNLPNVAVDLVTLLEKLDIEKTALLGYSMGGRVALYLALKMPPLFHSLILESASPGLARADERQQRKEQDELLARFIEVRGVPAFVERWQQLPLFASQLKLPKVKWERQKKQRLKNSAVGLANSLRGMGTGNQPSLWPYLSSLQVPTLLLAGALDLKYVNLNKKMAEKIPNARLQIIGGAGHNCHLEDPQQFTTTILLFLESGQDLTYAEKENE